MKIDIDALTEAELIDLNNRIVERLRFLLYSCCRWRFTASQASTSPWSSKQSVGGACATFDLASR